jgi:hypothetical protein
MTKRNDNVQQIPGVLNQNPPASAPETKAEPTPYNMPAGWHPAHETTMGIWGPLDAADEAAMNEAKVEQQGRQERQEWVLKNQQENEALLAPVTAEPKVKKAA